MVRGGLRQAAVLLVCLLVVGCEAPADDELVFAVQTAPRVLDPRLAADAASERVNALLYASLARLDSRGRAQPEMGRWTRISPRHYRVQLLPERLPFADGSLPMAADVVATYQSILSPGLGSPHASAFKHLDAVVAVTDTSVDFLLTRDDPQFPSRLTIGVLPAAHAASERPVESGVGSGTFSLLARAVDGGLLIERRRDGQRVRIQPTPDPTMRVLKLLRGEAQLLQNDLPAELFSFLDGVEQIELREVPGITFAYLGFNLSDPLLRQRELRQAIAHAIDRESIIRHLFDGRAVPAAAVLRPDHWAGAPGLDGFAFDPDRARSLLAGMGVSPERPLRLSYKTSTDPFRLRIAHVLQQQLADVGIDLRIQSYDWGTFFGDIKAGRFQLYSLAWVGVNTPDILRYAFHSGSLPPGGANRGGYRSAAVDRLIEQAERLPPAAAAPLYRAAQQRIRDDLVYVPLWYESNVAVSRGSAGFKPASDGNYLALNTIEVRHAK
jgi:peptide/nickel transport system substrate-binding protein